MTMACQIQGCDQPARARDLCGRHYRQMRRARPLPPIKEKACTKCELSKPVAEFNRHSSTADGLRPDCRACEKTYQRGKREERPASVEWRYHLKKSYNLTPEQVDEMLAKQDGGCAICGTTRFAGSGQRPNIDHDHATGRVRGLLCNGCNCGLGYFCDDPERLHKAIAYLRKNSE